MMHCDFSVRSARDEMRHIIGCSEPDVISGADKYQNRGCKKEDTDHMEFLCERYEAQAACGRHFVHELASEVNSRMQCVAKIMAMPGTRRTVVDLCMFGLAACDERGPGLSTQVYGWSPALDKLECGCKVNAQARINTLVLVRTTQERMENKQEHGYVKLSQCRSSRERVSRS